MKNMWVRISASEWYQVQISIDLHSAVSQAGQRCMRQLVSHLRLVTPGWRQTRPRLTPGIPWVQLGYLGSVFWNVDSVFAQYSEYEPIVKRTREFHGISMVFPLWMMYNMYVFEGECRKWRSLIMVSSCLCCFAVPPYTSNIRGGVWSSHETWAKVIDLNLALPTHLNQKRRPLGFWMSESEIWRRKQEEVALNQTTLQHKCLVSRCHERWQLYWKQMIFMKLFSAETCLDFMRKISSVQYDVDTGGPRSDTWRKPQSPARRVTVWTPGPLSLPQSSRCLSTQWTSK